ncbi:hypothetical protein GcC1_204035 [Golovinomyces cichoracearum]|uniref:HAT C-terminal dimerisation domain-containing protein n=1 Tax=Golovinomyces cichoracearum TaxID=62708 RepID=A0A420HCW2_9PEZI|nr:hypothetical protein GcC1_204035 [Golovinomyces cichoracearum]
MQNCYSKIRALIKTTPTRWGTRIAQIDFICNSENALKSYIAYPDATSSTIKSLLSTPQFWQKLSGLWLFFKPIHTHQKMSESNGATINKVYPRWIDINRHMNEFQLEESGSPWWQEINSYCTSTQGVWNQRMEKQLLSIHLAAYILTPENSKTVILSHFQEQINDFIRAKYGENSSAVASYFEYVDQEGPFNILANFWKHYTYKPLLFWKSIRHYCPELSKLAITLLTTTANSVASERSLSIMNLLQNRLRSRMGVETMDRLCYIYINCRSIQKLNNNKINGELSSGRDDRDRER